MTANRILQYNAISTAACAVGMLAARGILPGLFGLDTPLLMDVVAVGFLVYAAALAAVARRETVGRTALMVFAASDAAWVLVSALALLLFWQQMAPAGRLLVVVVGLVVEVFAALQVRAAGGFRRYSLSAR